MIVGSKEFKKELVETLVLESNQLSGRSTVIEVFDELNYKQEIVSNFYAYDKEKLIGFLNMFVPSKEGVEIQCIVHPNYRKKHVFTKLLAHAKAEMGKYKIYQTLFLCDDESLDGKETLERLGYRLNHSEYLMELKDECNQVSSKVFLEPVTLKEVKRYIKIAKDVFGKDGFPNELVHHCLQAENRFLFMILKDSVDIGIVSYAIEGDKISISGLGIHTKHRGFGYSKEALASLITEIKCNFHQKITLEVDSLNTIALEVYKKHGFSITKKINYYG